MRVSVIGTGYVGLTTSVALAYLGHKVTAVDKDFAKIDLLRKGKSPIREPGVETLIQLARENLVFVHSLGQKELSGTSPEDSVESLVQNIGISDVVLIAVGTPSKGNGEANTEYVENAVEEVTEGIVSYVKMQEGGAGSADPGNHPIDKPTDKPVGKPVVVSIDKPFDKQIKEYNIAIKSTVPVGTQRRVSIVVNKVLARNGLLGKVRIRVVSNPEFLRETRAVHDTLYPDRILIGTHDAKDASRLEELYRPILNQSFDSPPLVPRPSGYWRPRMLVTDPTSAEMIKYAANAFLAVKISFINEIAGLCEKVGADVKEVAEGIGSDPRIGHHFLAAGAGWGGSCLPKDTAALVSMGEEHNYQMDLVRAAREVNQEQRERLVERIQETLRSVRGRIVGVLGLAFKPGTDDVRESPALDIVERLIKKGASVRVHDPCALNSAKQSLSHFSMYDLEFCDDVYDVARSAEALMLVTEWPFYRTLDFGHLAKVMANPIFLDGRNFLDPRVMIQSGFIYMAVGRPSPVVQYGHDAQGPYRELLHSARPT